ncbi:hypothetical protein AeRB84_009534 [Aphanomyces euteiches]|nr:hypothetical protein AeRB84_009534 [Aphanomyces euteiches]
MLQVPEDVWSSVSMDYIFGLPRDGRGNTGIWTCVDRASKFLVAIPVKDSITAEQSAKLFFDAIYCRFGLPSSIVSDRDPRFTSKFWIALFSLVGTKLNMSTSDHPESDGQTERANRVIEDVLRCFAQSRQKTWSSLLPHVEFAYNTATNVTTGFSPFYVNFLRHPRLPSSIDDAILSGGGYWAASTHSAGWVPNTHEDDPPARTIASVEYFVKVRESIILQVQDNIALAQERQAKYANQQGRQNKNAFKIGDEVLLHRSVVPRAVLGNTKLQLQWWGPYPITKVISRTSFRLALPAEWNIHNVFYVGKLKPYIPRDSEAAQPERVLQTARPYHELGDPLEIVDQDQRQQTVGDDPYGAANARPSVQARAASRRGPTSHPPPIEDSSRRLEEQRLHIGNRSSKGHQNHGDVEGGRRQSVAGEASLRRSMRLQAKRNGRDGANEHANESGDLRARTTDDEKTGNESDLEATANESASARANQQNNGYKKSNKVGYLAVAMRSDREQPAHNIEVQSWATMARLRVVGKIFQNVGIVAQLVLDLIGIIGEFQEPYGCILKGRLAKKWGDRDNPLGRAHLAVAISASACRCEVHFVMFIDVTVPARVVHCKGPHGQNDIQARAGRIG